MDGNQTSRLAIEVFSHVWMSTAAQLQGDSLRRQTQLSEQYSAEHGLDLDEDDIGVSAFDGFNIVHHLPCVGGWITDAAGRAKCCPRCDSMRIHIAALCANCANLLSSPARSIAPDWPGRLAAEDDPP